MGDGVFCFCFSIAFRVGSTACTMNALYILVQYTSVALGLVTNGHSIFVDVLPMLLCGIAFSVGSLHA